MIDFIQHNMPLETVKKPKVKQVLLIFDDGTVKGYNYNAFMARLKEEIKK